MELQTSESSSSAEAPTTTNTPRADTPLPPPPGEQLSFSHPVLRFPRPQGSQELANWISNSSPDIMQPSSMSDTSSLADSAYEIIHGADSESPDDRLTESTCSLTTPATDDVHSLDGSEDPFRSDSEQESDHESHVSSIRYADQALQNPSTQNPTNNLDYGSSTEGSGVVVRSIEFQEPDSGMPILLETISAKHAVREFSEEESAALAHDLDLPNAPKRLVASIRQTMSQSYLSTEEPLRVLYVGRADAQRSIVLKICSAIWASPKNGSNDQDYFSRHRDGVYNIVPISSFGPAPELDLMEASHYQIKVEHCTTAQEVVDGEGDPTAEQALYIITVDQEKSYRFDCSQSGYVVEPRWDLPHIAVFYCSELDDAEAERTRDAAWSFMRRHGLPSLFIADQQHFRNPTRGKYIDEHSVHLCLESRDLERPMEPRRFPIDYASFADIDARQMNRNLAYLTGLSAPDDTEMEPEVRTVLEMPKQGCTFFADHQNLKRWIFAVVPMVVALITPYLVLPLIGLLRPGDISHIQPASSTGVCVSPLSGLTTSKASSVATSTKTVVINVTSTKTVQVSRTKPSTSTLASALSLAGFLSDRPSAVPADTEVKTPVNSGNTVCSVRVYSPTEFLVEIPSQNKAVWLARGAIDIVVRRSDDAVKTKFSSVDEGVLVELDPKDAYGVLNVSVVTTRRPKINETFQIDFGKSTLTEAFEAGLQILQSALGKVWRPDEAHQLFEDARRLPLDAVSALEHASGAVRNHTADTIEWLTGEFHTELAAQRKLAKALGVELRLGVIQAQIASRLWWLKMRGKEDQYAEYERNGTRFLKKMHEELRGGQEGKENNTPKRTKSYFEFRSMTSRSWSCKKACASRDESANDSASHGGSLKKTWKKLVRGV